MKSASASRNTTRRLPESMSDPRVGQLLADKDADVGAYARVSNPAALKTVSYAEGARSSELTISRDTTNGRQRGQLGFQYPPIALDPVSHSPSFGLASIHVFTAVYGKLSALFHTCVAVRKYLLSGSPAASRRLGGTVWARRSLVSAPATSTGSERYARS